jgi:hypothetical protein
MMFGHIIGLKWVLAGLPNLFLKRSCMLCAHMCLPGQVRGEGRYTLTLVFEAKNLKLSDFEDRQVLLNFLPGHFPLSPRISF